MQQNMTQHIVFLDGASLQATLRRPGFEHTWTSYPRTSPDDVTSRIRDATMIITNKVVLDDVHLANGPRLRFIAVAATGTNNVDLKACRRREIQVSNVQGYATYAVSEHVFSLVLALKRNLVGYREAVKDGAWSRSDSFSLSLFPIDDLVGATLGVLGYGAIGQQTAALARAFGMNVLVAERPGAPKLRTGRTPFEAVLAQSDVVSLHLPLTEETRHLLDKSAFRMMKRTAMVINTSRGDVVDEKALAEALRSGEIAGAGLDVLTSEPPDVNNPLLAMVGPQLIVTPHVAWSSRQAQARLAEEIVQNLEAFERGAPRNLVT